MTPPRTPWQTLQEILRVDAAAPRVTFYERTPGSTQGERIELSGKVLVNWVSKAANLLSEEFDVSAGSRVSVNLPAAHWRTTYWCLAAWSLAATVVFVDSDEATQTTPSSDGGDALGRVDVLVTDVPDDSFDGDQIVVSLPMLARSATVEVPRGAVDEAMELSTFGDVFVPFEQAAPHDAALQIGETITTYADLTTSPDTSKPVAVSPPTNDHGARRLLASPSPDALMQALAAGGSVVLVRGPVTDEELARILDQESAVTA